VKVSAQVRAAQRDDSDRHRCALVECPLVVALLGDRAGLFRHPMRNASSR
jgi:hypothetical protein